MKDEYLEYLNAEIKSIEEDIKEDGILFNCPSDGGGTDEGYLEALRACKDMYLKLISER